MSPNAVRARLAPSPSDLLTAMASASSRTPFLIPCSSSPDPGSARDEEEVDHLGDGGLSLADADGLDQDDVEPRGLTEEQDHRLCACGARCLRASCLLGDGRMNAHGSSESRPIRVLSPRIEPPESVLDGSIARTATR